MKLQNIESAKLLPSIYLGLEEYEHAFICEAFDKFIKEFVARGKTLRCQGKESFINMTPSEQLMFLKDCGIDWFFSDISEDVRASYLSYISENLSTVCRKDSLEHLLKFVFDDESIEADIERVGAAVDCEYTIHINADASETHSWTSSVIERCLKYVEQFWPVHISWDKKIRVDVLSSSADIFIQSTTTGFRRWVDLYEEYIVPVERDKYEMYLSSSGSAVGVSPGESVYESLFDFENIIERGSSFVFPCDTFMSWGDVSLYDSSGTLIPSSQIEATAYNAFSSGHVGISLNNKTNSTINVKKAVIKFTESLSSKGYGRSASYQPANINLSNGSTGNIYAYGSNNGGGICVFSGYHSNVNVTISSFLNASGTDLGVSNIEKVQTTWTASGHVYIKIKNVSGATLTWSNVTMTLN